MPRIGCRVSRRAHAARRDAVRRPAMVRWPSTPLTAHTPDTTRRTVSQPVDMIGMRVSDDDGVGTRTRDVPQPVGAAIDHHPGSIAGDESQRVPVMPSRPHVDLATGAEERERHANPSLYPRVAAGSRCDAMSSPCGSALRRPRRRDGGTYIPICRRVHHLPLIRRSSAVAK